VEVGHIEVKQQVQVKEINVQISSSLRKEGLLNPCESKNLIILSISSQPSLSEIMYSISLLPFLVDFLKNCLCYYDLLSVLVDF